MKYRIVDAATVQPRPSRTAARHEVTGKLVRDLTPGKVAAVTPEGAETVRGVKSVMTRAGLRNDRPVRCWDADGVVYVALRPARDEG